MALQRINWTQIDTEHVPSGSTIDIGALVGPVDAVHTDELSILGIDFFEYLDAVGYTGSTPNTIIVENNAGLRAEHHTTGTTLSTTYNTALEPVLSMPAAVGGIALGTTVAQLSGKTFVEFVDELLFPNVLPTYTIPTIIITGVATQNYEVGRTYAPNIGVYGVKNDAGAYTKLRILRNSSPILTDTGLTESSATDIVSQFGYDDPNNPNKTYAIFPVPYSESYVIPEGTTAYKGDGDYNSGLSKQNNKGNYDVRTPEVRSVNAPQLSGNSFSTSTYTVTGLYPYFWGTSLTLPTVSSIAAAIAGGMSNKVLSSASGTLSIPYNISDQYIWVAYYTNYTTKTKWYVTALDNGSIDDSFISTVASNDVNSPDGYWSNITFKMHWSVYPTIQNTIEFRNS